LPEIKHISVGSTVHYATTVGDFTTLKSTNKILEILKKETSILYKMHSRAKGK
jgi:hypothetical protein